MPRNPGRDLGQLQEQLRRQKEKRERDAAALAATDAEIDRLEALIASYDGVDVTAAAGSATGTGGAKDAG